jgi:hypothetical protein
LEALGFLEDLPTLMVSETVFLLSTGNVAAPGSVGAPDILQVLQTLTIRTLMSHLKNINFGINHLFMPFRIPSLGLILNFKNFILIYLIGISSEIQKVAVEVIQAF